MKDQLDDLKIHHERDLLMSKEEVKVPFTFVFGGREKDFASSLISLIFYNKDPLFFGLT